MPIEVEFPYFMKKVQRILLIKFDLKLRHSSTILAEVSAGLPTFTGGEGPTGRVRAFSE